MGSGDIDSESMSDEWAAAAAAVGGGAWVFRAAVRGASVFGAKKLSKARKATELVAAAAASAAAEATEARIAAAVATEEKI